MIAAQSVWGTYLSPGTRLRVLDPPRSATAALANPVAGIRAHYDLPMRTRPLPARWLRADLLFAAVLLVTGWVMIFLSNAAELSFYKTPLWQQMVGSTAVALPLVWRRRFPLVSGLVQAVAFIIASIVTGMDLYATQVALFLGFYSMGAWSTQRGHALLARIVVVTLMGLSLFLTLFKLFDDTGAQAVSASVFVAGLALKAILNVAYFTGAWFFGDRAYEQALERSELVAAKDRIIALQFELVSSAVEEERLRIARELHDVVAHHVTVMSVQSAAARRILHRDPESAATALKGVESSARRAVQDLRTMVLTLRACDEPTDRLPTLADVQSLVENARAGGQTVEFEIIDEPHGLSPAAELTLYRVAQEGLTNAAKHAGPGARVSLRLRNRPGAVEFEVSDDGRGLSAASPGSGTGLQGMRERVQAVGGTVETGPKPRGGYRVRVELPTVVRT